jgi:hypothetical protein
LICVHFTRREIHADTLREDIIFWVAFDLAFCMHDGSFEQALLTRCLFRTAREGELTQSASWINGWRCGRCDAERETETDASSQADLSAVYGRY